MTGDQLLQYTLGQAKLKEDAIDQNKEDFDQWALDTINEICADTYNTIQSQIPHEEKETEKEYHDFISDADYDVYVEQPTHRIQRVYVKYSEHGLYRKSNMMPLSVLHVAPEDVGKYSNYFSPDHLIIRNRMSIYPRPNTDIKDGILIHYVSPYNTIEEMSDNLLTGLEDTQNRKVLVPLFLVKIYERLKKYDVVEYYEKKYEKNLQEATKQVTRRVGDTARITRNTPVYL